MPRRLDTTSNPSRALSEAGRSPSPKKLFRVAFSRKSVVGIAFQRVGPVTYELIPDGYHPEWLKEPHVMPNGNTHVYTNNPDLFWQSPTVDRSTSLIEITTDKP